MRPCFALSWGSLGYLGIILSGWVDLAEFAGFGEGSYAGCWVGCTGGAVGGGVRGGHTVVLGRVRREVWVWVCFVWCERVGSFDGPVCA